MKDWEKLMHAKQFDMRFAVQLVRMEARFLIVLPFVLLDPKTKWDAKPITDPKDSAFFQSN